MSLLTTLRKRAGVIVPPTIVPPPYAVPWSFTINGVERSNQMDKGSLKVGLARGSRHTLSCSIVDAPLADDSLAYRPDLDDIVVLTINGVAVFGGYITDCSEGPHGGFSRGVVTQIQCADWSIFLDRILITQQWGATLLPVLIATTGVRCWVTTDADHDYTIGSRVVIAGVVSSIPDVNGVWTVTDVSGPRNFQIPIEVFAAGGGGTVRRGYLLKEVVTEIVSTKLAGYGWSLDSMGDGPVLGSLTFDNTKLLDVFNGFTDMTGRIWRVSASKVLSVFYPGEKVAPFNLTRAQVNSPITWSKSRGVYANRIVVHCGPSGQSVVRTQNFVCDGVSRHGWVVFATADYPAEQDVNSTWPNVLYFNGVAQNPISWGYNSSFAWYWDAQYHRLAHNQDLDTNPATAIPPAGTLISLSYSSPYPFAVSGQDDADIAAKGPFDAVYDEPTVTDLTSGQSLVASLLLRLKQAPRSLQCGTLFGLAYPGDTMTLTFPNRLVSGPQWTIESCGISLWGSGIFYYEYAFTEGFETQKTWVENMRDLTQGGTGSSSSSSGSPPAPAGGYGGGGSTTIVQSSVTANAYFLGGSEIEYVHAASSTWIPASAVRVSIDTGVRGTTAARVTLRMRAAGGSITARLWNTYEGVSVGTSATITSTSWVDTSFPVTLTAGVRLYELQVLPSLANQDVAAIGYVE